MTVKAAAVAQQRVERPAPASTQPRRVARGEHVAFVAALGVVEAAWVLLLITVVRLFV